MFNKRSKLLLSITTLVLVAATWVQAANLKDIDKLILTKDTVKIKQAISQLEDELREKPQNANTLWMMAKAYLYLGDRTKDGQLAVFEQGKAYADQAVEILPTSPHTHFWQSALIGRVGQTRGIFSSLFMVRPMKDALDRALELDQNYADAYWVLSQLYEQAPGFPLSIGNKKLALEHAKKAVELDPNYVEYQLQLVVVLNLNGQKDEATLLLTDLLTWPTLHQDPELHTEAKDFFAKLTR